MSSDELTQPMEGATTGASADCHDRVYPKGSVVDRYVLLNAIGRGGSGVVYAAWDPHLERRIALKLISASTQSSSHLREARLLAQLNHPGIVTVYDAFTTANALGIAMELVHGIDLSRWIGDAGRGSTWQQRCELLRQAGRAIVAAHRHGIVHGDIKPANVLVDSTSHAKVTDFGVARLAVETAGSTRQESDSGLQAPSEDASLTRRSVAGTWNYLAPEQHRGAPATEASDTYAFCWTAWEVLFETPPFPTGDDLVEHKLRGAPLVAREAKVPRRLVRALIAGLSPSPTDRPALPELLEAFARDPRPRRAVTFSLGASAVAGMVGFTVLRNDQTCSDSAAPSFWSAEARKGLHERFAAANFPGALELGTDVATALDDYATRWQEQHLAACTATQRGEQSDSLLDLRMACLDRSRRQLDALVTGLEAGDSEALARASDAVSALAQPEQCGDREHLLGTPQPPEEKREAIAAATAELDALWTGERLGRFRPTLEALTGLVEQADAIAYPPLSSEVFHLKGTLEEHLSRLDDAAASWSRAYEDAVTADDAELAASIASHLMRLDTWRERTSEAGIWSVAARAQISRLDAPDAARAKHLFHEGLRQSRDGAFSAAADTYTEALALAESLEDRRLLVAIHAAIASNADDRGEHVTARDHHARAVELARDAFGETHPLTLRARRGRVRSLMLFGHTEEARAELDQILAHAIATYGDEHVEVAMTLNARGIVEIGAGEWEAAHRVLEAALPLYRAHYGEKHVGLVPVLSNFGIASVQTGRLERARTVLEQALEIEQEGHGPDSSHLSDILNILAAVHVELRDDAAAVQLLERDLALTANNDEMSPFRRASTKFDLARVLHRLNSGDPRVIDLASAAHATFASAPGVDAAVGERETVERWARDFGVTLRIGEAVTPAAVRR